MSVGVWHFIYLGLDIESEYFLNTNLVYLFFYQLLPKLKHYFVIFVLVSFI